MDISESKSVSYLDDSDDILESEYEASKKRPILARLSDPPSPYAYASPRPRVFDLTDEEPY